MSLSADAIVCRNASIMFTDVGGTIITMNIESGYYHELNPVASRIWHIIETPQSVGGICEQLVQEYDVDADDCMRDVVEFLADFDTLKLVEIKA